MKKFGYVAVALLLAGSHQAAFAQTRAKARSKPAAAASATPSVPSASGNLTPEQQEHAIQDFGVMSSAMRSENVPNDVKSALMNCIYTNSLSAISSAIDKLSAANPGKVDRKSADSVLGAMAAACGYQPSAAPAGTAAPAPAPAPQQGATVGR